MSPCPTPETLGRLACASSSGSRFAAMEAHVADVHDCQEVLERLAADASVSRDVGPDDWRSRSTPPRSPVS